MFRNAKQYDNEFVAISVSTMREINTLRECREALRQKLGNLSIRKMELQLQRRSQIVIDHQIAEYTEAKNQVVLEIDALLSQHTAHLRTCIHA